VQHQDGNFTPGREERWGEGIEFISQLLSQQGSRMPFAILDIGCGDGHFYRALKLEVVKKHIDRERLIYFGLDKDSSYRGKVEKIGGRFICGDILDSKILAGEKKFDLIIASDVIEHIDETDTFIRRIKTMLKPSGFVYLTTPNLAAWHCRLMLLFGLQPLPTEVSNISSAFGKGAIGRKIYGDNTIHHIRVFTRRALIDFLRYHKMEIVKSYGSGYRKIDRIIFRKTLRGYAPVIIAILKNKSDSIDKKHE